VLLQQHQLHGMIAATRQGAAKELFIKQHERTPCHNAMSDLLTKHTHAQCMLHVVHLCCSSAH
jgi:hypothetical protein